MSVTAKKVLDIMRGWVGCKESDGSHKPIIDIYNAYRPLARGYALRYTDSWCDAAVSAAAIKAGAVSLIGTECGVQEHVQIFKKLGIWIEDGRITPKPGDIIVYNWEKAPQPNDGYADHIGFVESVTNGLITTIEGNYQDSVKRRKVSVGNGYIRGYARPKYTSDGNAGKKPDKNPVAQTPEKQTSAGTCTVELQTFVQGNSHDQIRAIQRILRSLGYKGRDKKVLTIDGHLGKNTAYAIEQFQKKNGMKDINFGSVAEKTWKLLLNAK